MKKGRLKKFLAGVAMGLCALAMPFGLVGCDKEDDINVRFADNYFQWQVEGEDGWNNVISIDELKDLLGEGYKGDTGATGAQGQQGVPGIDGREVEFRTNATHIQWRYVGESNWKNLLEISSINSNNNTDKSINVCYHMNGGENPKENTILKELSESNQIKLTRPTKDGFTFVNWYLDEECTKEFDGYVCIEDIREDKTLCLYAKWTNEYAIEGTKFRSMNNKDIESFVIPEYVTSIEDEAFEDCTKLKELTIPNGVEYMGWGSIFGYRGGYSEGSIKIFYNGTIKEWAGIGFGTSWVNFFDREIELYCNGHSVTRIEKEDLEGVRYIPTAMFADIVNLEYVALPSSVETIGRGAFANCINLTIFNISDSVTEISEYAFGDCSKLTTVSIGNGVTKIEECAFARCTSLEKITIPSSVTIMNQTAFSGCDNLKTIVIDSENVANSLIDDPKYYGDNDVIIAYATQVYIKTGLITTNSTYLLNNFTKQETSDKDGYDMYVRNAE